MKLLKIVSLIIVVALVLNIIFFALGKITQGLFWFIILLGAVSSLVINKVIKK